MYIHRFMGQVLCRLLILPKGFIPSVLNHNLMFLGSAPNSSKLRSKFLHWAESAGCLSFPSFLHSSECQRSNLVSFRFANKRFKHGITSRYHNILAGGPYFTLAVFLCLYRDALNTGHTCMFAYSLRYRIQSFGHTCILSTSIPNGQRTFLAW